MISESKLREKMVLHGRSLFERGYSCGSSGNLSARLDDGFLVTPTNSCLGRLDPDCISKLDQNGHHLSGSPPSKEAFLHLAIYAERPAERAVVHLHSSYCVAVSCLAELNPDDVLPPITPYYVMRVGRLPLVQYYAPGDGELAEAVRKRASKSRAMLLANHGPVIAGKGLDEAVYAAEELEETAKLYLLLNGHNVSALTQRQVHDLHQRFPN